jgi:hypothetical protein
MGELARTSQSNKLLDSINLSRTGFCMSLTSLAQREILRKEQPTLRGLIRPTLHKYVSQSIAPKYSITNTQDVSSLTEDLLSSTPVRSLEQTQASNVLDGLVKYIPTESITLYIAAFSAMDALKSTFNFITEERVYWFFSIFTPILFLLIYAGKRRSNQLTSLPPQLKNLPWWKLIASTIAFLVWALAIPTAPYLHSPANPAGGVVAGFFALFISTVLSLLEPLFEPQTP